MTMKHPLTRLSLTLVLLTVLLAQPAAAQDFPPDPEPDAGAVVCPPGAYPSPPGDCLPLGPSAYLSELARLGITIPPRPLPATQPDPALVQLPYHYFKVNEITGTSLYGSLDAAISKAGGVPLLPGFVYLSYTDHIEPGKGHYFLLRSGEWIAGDGERIRSYSEFQGVQLSSTPVRPFGWVNKIDFPQVRAAPGYQSAKTGKVLKPYTTVQVYDTVKDGNMNWYLIGPNEWVEGRLVGIVHPNPTPPEGVTNGRWIEVNLEQQTLAVYEDSRMVYATLIASGLGPLWTKPGLFQIYEKKETELMRNNDPSDFYYIQDVPWTMYFDEARALHGAFWRTGFGYPQSHGCVNLSVGDSHWLFNWADVGDWVYVHDPSGLTPTDPSLYGAGAP